VKTNLTNSSFMWVKNLLYSKNIIEGLFVAMVATLATLYTANLA